ncbi:MAG: fibronectin type III domain-containing protein [Bacteroidota bacterium]
MPTLHLRFNTTNTVPASTDPLHSKSFTVDLANDREVVERSVVHDDMLDWSIAKDIIGLQRTLQVYLRTSDIKNSIDFLTSYFIAPYRWAMIPDAGYYFNLGTIASPTVVPVEFQDGEQQMNVANIAKNGIKLITKETYARPSAPTASVGSPTSSSLTITCNNTKLKFKVYRSATSGGTLTFIGESTGNTYIDTGLNQSTTYYYKVTIVTIAGESEYSAEVNGMTAPT